MPTTLLALEYIPRGDINNWDIREDANKDKIDLILGTQHNVTTGAHDTITPETASTGSIGSLAKPYANLYVDAVPTPTQAVQPANKEYVDSVVNGLDWQNSVLSKALTTPPGSPVQGDRYIIAVGATGAWAGQDNNITEYNGTSWDFFTVNKGFATWVEAENVNYTWTGTAWVKFGSTVTHANLIGLSADDHPQYYNQARGDARYLQLTGGTVDNLTIAPTSGIATLVVNAADGVSNARIQLQDAGIVRWELIRGDNTGDFSISRYGTAGAYQDSPFRIDDVTGNISVVGTVDGRDISVDGAKLDGIEAGADVTDAVNVAGAGAVMDSDFAGAQTGRMRRTGAASYAVVKDNLAATAAPTATNDSTAGYEIGSIWIDTTNDLSYVCVDATASAAVWAAGGGGLTDANYGDITVSGGGTVMNINSGAVGAPEIAAGAVGASEIATNAVHQAELNTTIGSVSTSGSTDLTLPGGQYGFYPQVKRTGAGGVFARISNSVISTSYVTNIYLSISPGPAYAKQRYILASPPFDLGNGDIPAFVFCLINKTTGDIESTYVAAAPPWAYNGPTNIAPDRYAKNGKGYQRRLILPWTKAEALADPVKKAENVQALVNPQYEEVLVTMDMKNADMPLIPHPFPNHDPSTHDVVLADPLSELAHAAGGLLDIGDVETVNEMLEGYVTLGNTPLSGLITPPGVIGVKATLK